jgi:hypothetical protein
MNVHWVKLNPTRYIGRSSSPKGICKKPIVQNLIDFGVNCKCHLGLPRQLQEKVQLSRHATF